MSGRLEGQHTVLAEEWRGREAVCLFLVAPLALVEEVAELDGLARLERNALRPHAFLLVELHGMLVEVPFVEGAYDGGAVRSGLSRQFERHTHRLALRAGFLCDHVAYWGLVMGFDFSETAKITHLYDAVKKNF